MLHKAEAFFVKALISQLLILLFAAMCYYGMDVQSFYTKTVLEVFYLLVMIQAFYLQTHISYVRSV